MFLALNEIMHSKLRYALVAGVMFLIAYLVFFLTGLAYGLAQDNRTAVDKWEADSIVLSKDAQSNLPPTCRLSEHTSRFHYLNELAFKVLAKRANSNRVDKRL